MIMNYYNFRGYSIKDDIVSIAHHYEEIMGFAPTLIVVPVGYSISDTFDECKVVCSPSVSLVLATHEGIDWQEPKGGEVAKLLIDTRLGHARKPGQGNRSNFRGRLSSVCPHCQQEIRDWEALGFWHGWATGKEPPYWGALRRYVWERDDKHCARCGDAVALGPAACHHVHAKEDNGSDSARNLVTLCSECHNYLHDTNYSHLTIVDKSYLRGTQA